MPTLSSPPLKDFLSPAEHCSGDQGLGLPNYHSLTFLRILEMRPAGRSLTPDAASTNGSALHLSRGGEVLRV